MSKVIFNNKSRTYLMPLLSEFVDFNTNISNNIKNTYLSKGSDTEKMIHILSSFDGRDVNFSKYEDSFINNDLFVEMKDYGNDVLYTFKFPEEYSKEYNYFLDSKYSKFDKDAKELILAFWGEIYSGNNLAIPILLKIKQILYRDEKLRKEIENKIGVRLSSEAELGELIIFEDEIFHEEEYLTTKTI